MSDLYNGVFGTLLVGIGVGIALDIAGHPLGGMVLDGVMLAFATVCILWGLGMVAGLTGGESGE